MNATPNPLDPSNPSSLPTQHLPHFTQGDRCWEQRQSVWREREAALPWPSEMLDAFSLRMASHGMSISRPLMLSDKRYALEQLVHAQTLCDETLRLMSVQLFRHFVERQAGIPSMH